MRPDAGDVLERFLGLTIHDVANEATGARGSISRARTWDSLANLMRRKEYWLVRELGVPAATSWAVHLGVIGPRGLPAASTGARRRYS